MKVLVVGIGAVGGYFGGRLCDHGECDVTLAASCVPNGVDEQISAELKKYWDDGEIVEILGVISLFGFLNRWNDTMGTTLEDPPAALGETHLKSQGWNRGKHV